MFIFKTPKGFKHVTLGVLGSVASLSFFSSLKSSPTFLSTTASTSASSASSTSSSTSSSTPPSKLTYHPTAEPHRHWVDFEGKIQANMKYREGDIVVSVPGKSGTTWTMNIVHQLRSGGDPKVRDVYEQVPWLEFWEYPNQPVEELYHRWDGLPTWFPRAFKSHAPPPVLPYIPTVKYIVVVRDPRDAVASMLPFMQAHSDDLFKEYHMERPPWKTVDDFFYSPWSQKGVRFFAFVKNWWPLRNNPNVLMLHYSDMVKDHRGSIKKIQQFLGINLTSKQFDDVCEYTSFAWMKKHGDKFTMQHLLPVALMSPEGMVRKGAVGEGQTVLSKQALKDFDEECDKFLTPEQKAWMLNGGSHTK